MSLARLVEEVAKHLPEPMSAEEYQHLDDTAPTMDTTSPLADTPPAITGTADEDTEEAEEDTPPKALALTTIPQALELLDQLKDFCAHRQWFYVIWIS